MADVSVASCFPQCCPCERGGGRRRNKAQDRAFHSPCASAPKLLFSPETHSSASSPHTFLSTFQSANTTLVCGKREGRHLQKGSAHLAPPGHFPEPGHGDAPAPRPQDRATPTSGPVSWEHGGTAGSSIGITPAPSSALAIAPPVGSQWLPEAPSSCPTVAPL